MPDRTARLAELIAGDFYGEGLKLPESAGDAPRRWEGTEEYKVIKALRDSDVGARTIRLFLTFVAAMSRDRQFLQLLSAARNLLASHPELYEPVVVAAMPLGEIRERLQHLGVSRKHRPDSEAWLRIARSLTKPGPVTDAIRDGEGNATKLLWELDSLENGEACFPLLRGGKSGPLWVGWLAALGGARLEDLSRIPIAVDTHIRKVSKELRVVDSGDAKEHILDQAIRSAWLKAVDGAIVAPSTGVAGSCAALNSPLWLLGQYGSNHYKHLVRP